MKFLTTNGRGILLCLVIAIPAWILGTLFPIIGGPVIAILLGMLLAIPLKEKGSMAPGIQFTSKKILQWAVILLGFGLDLTVVLKTGQQSLPIILCTITVSLLIAFLLYKVLPIPAKSATLIGVGSSICGGSAIAATAPVIGADDEEIAQAMITMAEDQEERERMGEAGYKRVNAFYRIEQMKDVYREIYKELSDRQKLTWTEEPFELRR